MTKIIELLHQRSENSAISSDNSIWEVYQNHERNLFIIAFEGLIAHGNLDEHWRSLLDTYSLIGEYSLGRPYVNSEFRFSLYHLSKERKDGFRSALYSGPAYKDITMVGCEKKLMCPQEYTDAYETYINFIESWIETNVIPIDDPMGRFEFNSADSSVTEKINSPREYSKRYNQVLKLIGDSETRHLSDYAKVFSPQQIDSDGRGAVVCIGEQRPFEYNSASYEYGVVTDARVQRGDIIFPMDQVDAMPYYFNFEPQTEVFCSSKNFLIRCVNIDPDFLWLYLTSAISQDIFSILTGNRAIRTINYEELLNYPIITEQKDRGYYGEITKALSNPNERNYPTYFPSEEAADSKTSIADLLDIDVVKHLKVFREEQLKTFLENDLKELSICMEGKAYKATLILAGSILEAVLIDWLSEIEGVDYFKKDYCVKGRDGKRKRADLIDYIDAIKYINRPTWVEEANEAHVIRQKRNLVHAKLCINEDSINEKTCQTVIKYLNDVLLTRGSIKR